MKGTKSIQLRPRRRFQDAYVDLHMHSRFSDGLLDVQELIEGCLKCGMTAMAITDHDNIDAFEEGREFAQQQGIEFIPGVELSAFHSGSDIHILGYYFDPTNLHLNQTLQRLKQQRKKRARLIVEKLQAQGLQIQYEQVAEMAPDGSLGRAHIANLLIQEEYVTSFKQAFDDYLSNEKIGDLQVEKLSPEEAIHLILQAGGVPVLAHPSKTDRDDLLCDMVDAGLLGIETYCNSLSNSTLDRYLHLSRKFDLVCCGGGDFHGFRPGDYTGLGQVRVPYKSLAMLKSYAS